MADKINSILKIVGSAILRAFVSDSPKSNPYPINFINIAIETIKENRDFQICIGVFGIIFLAFYSYYTANAMKKDRPGPNNTFLLFATGLLVIFNLFLIVAQFIDLSLKIWPIWIVMVLGPIASLVICYIIYYPGAKNGLKLKKKLATERILCIPVPCKGCRTNIVDSVKSKLKQENKCTGEKSTRMMIKALVIVCFAILVFVDALLYWAITNDAHIEYDENDTEGKTLKAIECIVTIYRINVFFMLLYAGAALVELITLFIVPCVKPIASADEIKCVLFDDNQSNNGISKYGTETYLDELPIDDKI